MPRYVVTSADAVSGGSPTNFVYELPDGASMPPGEYWIDSIQLSNNFYNITTRNNAFRYEVLTNGIRGVSILPGIYYADTLVETLQEYFESFDPGLFTVSYSDQTQRISIACTSSWTFYTNDAVNDTLMDVIGFRTHTTVVGVSVTKTGGSVLQLQDPVLAFLHIEGASGEVHFQGGHAVFMIPIDTDAGKTVYIDARSYRQRFRMKIGQQKLRVRLTDARGNLLDNNGAHWSFAIQSCD